MRKELRVNKDGSSYYSFVYYDSKNLRRVRLGKDYLVKRFGKILTTEEEAEEALKILSAEVESLHLRIDKRSQWEKEFYSFKSLLSNYEDWQRKRAPNSYKNNIHFMKNYVLHYFLMILHSNNISEWPDHYDSFRDWLESKAELLKSPGRLISYASKNHCIRALNTFMRLLHRQRVIDRLVLCESFPEHKIKQRTVDDLISPEEMERVYRQLKSVGYLLESTFFRLLYFTGMRFNEALGLSLPDLFDGEIENSLFKDKVKQYGIQYHGYLVIESQPSHKTRSLRDNLGRIQRKPLKGKNKIDEKNSRVILITDEKLWKSLVQLYNSEVTCYEKKVWGGDSKDYAFFDGLDKATATRRLKVAFENVGIRYRSWHCCRHTCATKLVGKTGDSQFVKLWLGHASQRVFDRYNHLYQVFVRNAKKREVGGGFRRII